MSKRDSEFMYMELAAMIRTQILSGVIKPGEFLMSEHDMCNKYMMSRTPVRNALKQLALEGLITKIQGRGTMVSTALDLEDDSSTLIIASPYPSSFTRRSLPLLIRSFHERHPDIRVKVISIPSDMNKEVYSRQFVSVGVHPDLIVVQDRDFQHLKQLDDFEKVIDMGIELPAIHPTLLRCFQIDGRQLGVPLTFSPVVMMHNPELFERYQMAPPEHDWSREQFARSAIALTRDLDQDGIIDLYGAAIHSLITRWPALVLPEWRQFRHTRSPEDRLSLIRRFDEIRAWIYRDHLAPVFALNDEMLALELFVEGKIGMYMTTLLGFDDAWDYPLTSIPGSNSGLLIANGMLVTRASRKKKEAKLFLELLLDREVQLRVSETSGLLSPLTDVNQSIRGEERMEAIGADDRTLDQSLYIHDLLPDPEAVHELYGRMKHYWSGMETAEAMLERISDLMEPITGH